MKKDKVIVRFAPSPTGLFHIGSARTTLFNYLFARHNKGKVLFRIEDTDKSRSKPEYEADIIESLNWLGIDWDGEIIKQSERGETYKTYLEKLLDEDKAYCCFCTHDELEAQRQEQMSRGMAPKYNGKCASLSKKEGGVIRFRNPGKIVKFNDAVRGEIEFDTSLMGDFVIAKNLDEPLYNFTVVIDDYEMEITNVIRGEDHIPNTPKQILLQEALGFPTPVYGHLPLILGSDRSKMSKRHGATSVNSYRKDGYLPDAVINFIAFLGWNPGDEKEMYSLKDLIKDFTLEKIQKSGAVFNADKLDYINGWYIRQKPLNELTDLCIPYLIEAGLIIPDLELEEKNKDMTGILGKELAVNFTTETGEKIKTEYIAKTISIYQERLKKLSEIGELVDFFYKEPEYDKDLLKWKDATNDQIKTALEKSKQILEELEWNKENLEKIMLIKSEEISLEIKDKKDRGLVLWPLRVALTGKKSSAGPFEIADILGKEKTIKRIIKAINA